MMAIIWNGNLETRSNPKKSKIKMKSKIRKRIKRKSKIRIRMTSGWTRQSRSYS